MAAERSAATTPERQDYLWGRLIAALNGYRISPDDAWDVLKEWMRLVKAERMPDHAPSAAQPRKRSLYGDGHDIPEGVKVSYHDHAAAQGFRVSFPGPFSAHYVVVDGWKVPLLAAHPTGEHDESVMLVLDDRLAETFKVEEAERVVPFLAHAIAIALGYTCHPNSDEEPIRKPQPRPVRTHGIVGIKTEEVGGDAE